MVFFSLEGMAISSVLGFNTGPSKWVHPSFKRGGGGGARISKIYGDCPDKGAGNFALGGENLISPIGSYDFCRDKNHKKLTFGPYFHQFCKLFLGAQNT